LEGTNETAIIPIDLEVGIGSIWSEAPVTMLVELPLKFEILEAFSTGMS
jgi:hypothetical protein